MSERTGAIANSSAARLPIDLHSTDQYFTDLHSPELYDVAVIGAGPAGGSAAAALAGQGWRVALIERTSLPRHKVCGEFLSPEAQATLQNFDLQRELAALKPAPLTGATLTSRRGATLDMTLPGTAWGLSRFAMDAGLAQAAVARGADLFTETTALDVTRNEADFAVSLRARGDAGALRARTVIMAGGRQSAPKLPPAGPTRPREELYVGVKGHVLGVAMPNQVELYLFDGGYVGLNAVEGAAVNVCLLATYAEFARGEHALAGMIGLIGRQNSAFAARMEGAVLLGATECTVAAVDTNRPAVPWANMACLGDTATMIPPLCGDGMAMALRSAELCVPLAHAYLRGDITLDQWRTAYSDDWHAEFAGRLRTGRALQALLNRAPVADALIAAGKLAPQLADYFVRATRGSSSPPINHSHLPVHH